MGGSQHTQNIILGEKEESVLFLWKKTYGLLGQCILKAAEMRPSLAHPLERGPWPHEDWRVPEVVTETGHGASCKHRRIHLSRGSSCDLCHPQLVSTAH